MEEAAEDTVEEVAEAYRGLVDAAARQPFWPDSLGGTKWRGAERLPSGAVQPPAQRRERFEYVRTFLSFSNCLEPAPADHKDCPIQPRAVRGTIRRLVKAQRRVARTIGAKRYGPRNAPQKQASVPTAPTPTTPPPLGPP